MGGGAVVAAVALVLAVATVMAKPASPPAAIVSQGDSFISGEGGGGYGASAENGCHRSAMAPIRSAPIEVDEKINIACSGAQTENIWRVVSGGKPHRGEPPQADQLAAIARRFDVKLVVLTVGANDLGFGAIVADCALDWARSHPGDPRHCHGDAQRKIESRLPAAARSLRKAVREIRAALATAGHRLGDYRLLVMGYASPFPPGSRFRYPESGWARLTKGGCPVWNADADWARRWALPAIASTMRSAAAAEGAEYLDVRRALVGHEVCARGVSEFDHHIGGSNSLTPLESRSHTLREWFRPLRLTGRVRESLHPNRIGQRVIGRCLAQAYAEAIPTHRRLMSYSHDHEASQDLSGGTGFRPRDGAPSLEDPRGRRRRPGRPPDPAPGSGRPDRGRLGRLRGSAWADRGRSTKARPRRGVGDRRAEARWRRRRAD